MGGTCPVSRTMVCEFEPMEIDRWAAETYLTVGAVGTAHIGTWNTLTFEFRVAEKNRGCGPSSHDRFAHRRSSNSLFSASSTIRSYCPPRQQ